MSVDWKIGWRLVTRLSVIDAVLLIIGVNPSLFNRTTITSNIDRPQPFDGLLAAVSDAILGKKLKADSKFTIATDRLLVGMVPPAGELERVAKFDPELTIVSVIDLKNWLIENSIYADFFSLNALDPLNRSGPYYAPKLAAAISAWKATAADEAAVVANGNPKQAIEKWLAHHADEYGLSKHGVINDSAFEQISTITNWTPSGGRISSKSSSSDGLSEKKSKLKKK